MRSLQVNPVGHVMSTHVDCYPKAAPTDSLAALVAWGEDADAFHCNLNLQLLALQATRSGDDEAASALERISGLKPRQPPKQWRSKTERVRALLATDPLAHTLPPRLYTSDLDRRQRLASGHLTAFDGLAEGVSALKLARRDNLRARAEEMRKHKVEYKLALAAKHAAAEAAARGDAAEEDGSAGGHDSARLARASAARVRALEMAYLKRQAAAAFGTQTVARFPRAYVCQYRPDMPARANLGLT